MEEIEKNGVKPDGYKATDEEVAQQEEMIERKGLNDVVVAENATTSPTCKESLLVGNMAKLREALKKIIECHEYDYLSLDRDPGDALSSAADLAKTALAAPPRNCDVGTAEEQVKRWEEFCISKHAKWKIGSPIVESCDCPCYSNNSCNWFIWGQMPYERR